MSRGIGCPLYVHTRCMHWNKSMFAIEHTPPLHLKPDAYDRATLPLWPFLNSYLTKQASGESWEYRGLVISSSQDSIIKQSQGASPCFNNGYWLLYFISHCPCTELHYSWKSLQSSVKCHMFWDESPHNIWVRNVAQLIFKTKPTFNLDFLNAI